MGRKVIDISGLKFNSLTVLKFSHTKNGDSFFECMCECGSIKKYRGADIKNGGTKSCGCYRDEKLVSRFKKHGKSQEGGSYSVWKGIRKRCLNEKSHAYKYYGGRGISFCDRWKSYENFLEDMGEKPYHEATIERIDVNKNYCPENCIWVPKSEQSKNRRPSSEWNFKKKTGGACTTSKK